MNKLQIKLERLELMLVEDGYNDSNIVYKTLKEAQELAVNYNPNSKEHQEALLREIMQSDEEDGLYQNYSDQLKCCNCSCNEPVHKEGSVYCEFHKDM